MRGGWLIVVTIALGTLPSAAGAAACDQRVGSPEPTVMLYDPATRAPVVRVPTTGWAGRMSVAEVEGTTQYVAIAYRGAFATAGTAPPGTYLVRRTLLMPRCDCALTRVQATEGSASRGGNGYGRMCPDTDPSAAGQR